MASLSSLLPLGATGPIALVAAAVVAYALIGRLLGSGVARRFADHPNERSLHEVPVPRTGGIGIMAGFAIASLIIGWDGFIALLAIALACISLADDWRGLPIVVRFGAHFAAAIALVVHFAPPWPWWFSALVVVAIVWMTNLYNFMDGSDGLAGGMAMIGFGAYAFGAFQGGAVGLGWTAASLACGAAAFLAFNFPPARVFMGDAGSIPLGFLAAALGYAGYVQYVWPIWFPIVVFSPFIVDASITIVRRLAGGERIWQAHRKHYYQRMVRIGWGHRRVALAEYAVMVAMSIVALATTRAEPVDQVMTLGACAAFYLLVALWFDRRWRAHQIEASIAGEAAP